MLKVTIGLTLCLLSVIVECSYLKMPSFAIVGENVKMECDISHGDLPIKFITWSKDGKQFYKYSKHFELINITEIDGVQVKKDLSLNAKSITIDPVSLQSTGVYKCNMQIDHPSLDVGEMTGTLKVVPN